MSAQTRCGQQKEVTPTQEEGSGVGLKQRGQVRSFRLLQGSGPQIPKHIGMQVGANTPKMPETLVPLLTPFISLALEGFETPEVLPDPTAGSLPILTLITMVSMTVVWMYGGLMIQTPDIIAGGNNVECRQWARMFPGFYLHPIYRPISVKARTAQEP